MTANREALDAKKRKEFKELKEQMEKDLQVRWAMPYTSDYYQCFSSLFIIVKNFRITFFSAQTCYHAACFTCMFQSSCCLMILVKLSVVTINMKAIKKESKESQSGITQFDKLSAHVVYKLFPSSTSCTQVIYDDDVL